MIRPSTWALYHPVQADQVFVKCCGINVWPYWDLYKDNGFKAPAFCGTCRKPITARNMVSGDFHMTIIPLRLQNATFAGAKILDTQRN